MKIKLRNQMKYVKEEELEENQLRFVRKFNAHKPNEILEPEMIIPYRALKQTLDKTNEELKTFIERNRMHHTTFTEASRFADPKLIYGDRLANFSLIDIEQFFKNHNGAPEIGKVSARKDQFLTKEQVEALIEAKQLEEIKQAKLQAMRDKEQQEKQAQAVAEGGSKGIFQPKVRFKTEDHKVVKDMEPFVRQIIKDMKRHAEQISLGAVV